jgi:putative lipoprotein
MVLTLVGLAIVGCSGYGNDKKPADSTEVAKAPVPVPNPEPVAPVVKGAVTYRERLAIPEDAEVYLWIMDITPGLMIAQVVLADTTVKPLGKQIPIEFHLTYDPSKIVGDHDYGLYAAIRTGAGEMFKSSEATPVITKGKSNEVTLVLTRSTP